MLDSPQALKDMRIGYHENNTPSISMQSEILKGVKPCLDPERGPWVGTPLKTHKNIEFLSNSGPDSMKNYKATNPHSMSDHYQHASETPFKRRFAGGLMIAAYSAVWIHSPVIN